MGFANQSADQRGRRRDLHVPYARLRFRLRLLQQERALARRRSTFEVGHRIFSARRLFNLDGALCQSSTAVTDRAVLFGVVPARLDRLASHHAGARSMSRRFVTVNRRRDLRRLLSRDQCRIRRRQNDRVRAVFPRGIFHAALDRRDDQTKISSPRTDPGSARVEHRHLRSREILYRRSRIAVGQLSRRLRFELHARTDRFYDYGEPFDRRVALRGARPPHTFADDDREKFIGDLHIAPPDHARVRADYERALRSGTVERGNPLHVADGARARLERRRRRLENGAEHLRRGVHARATNTKTFAVLDCFDGERDIDFAVADRGTFFADDDAEYAARDERRGENEN